MCYVGSVCTPCQSHAASCGNCLLACQPLQVVFPFSLFFLPRVFYFTNFAKPSFPLPCLLYHTKCHLIRWFLFFLFFAGHHMCSKYPPPVTSHMLTSYMIYGQPTSIVLKSSPPSQFKTNIETTKISRFLEGHNKSGEKRKKTEKPHKHIIYLRVCYSICCLCVVLQTYWT